MSTRGPWVGTGWLIAGARCPGCGGRVVYNGNYYCDGGCDWAMDQEDPAHRSAADRRILRLAGVDDWGTALPEFSDQEAGR